MLFSCSEIPPPGLGTQIMQAIGPSLLPWSSEDPNISKFGGAMHAVLVSELHLMDRGESEDRDTHLQRIIKTYLVFAICLCLQVRPSRSVVSHPTCSALTIWIERCNLDEN